MTVEIRSMDDAPLDGTMIWGICHGNAITMFWHEGFNAFISEFRRMELAPGLTFEDGSTFKDHSPTIHHPLAWIERPKMIGDDA